MLYHELIPRLGALLIQLYSRDCRHFFAINTNFKKSSNLVLYGCQNLHQHTTTFVTYFVKDYLTVITS